LLVDASACTDLATVKLNADADGNQAETGDGERDSEEVAEVDEADCMDVDGVADIDNDE